MKHMEVFNDNDIAINRAAKELFRLTILAEQHRINRIENKSETNFSFRREYFQKAIKNLA